MWRAPFARGRSLSLFESGMLVMVPTGAGCFVSRPLPPMGARTGFPSPLNVHRICRACALLKSGARSPLRANGCRVTRSATLRETRDTLSRYAGSPCPLPAPAASPLCPPALSIPRPAPDKAGSIGALHFGAVVCRGWPLPLHAVGCRYSAPVASLLALRSRPRVFVAYGLGYALQTLRAGRALAVGSPLRACACRQTLRYASRPSADTYAPLRAPSPAPRPALRSNRCAGALRAPSTLFIACGLCFALPCVDACATRSSLSFMAVGFRSRSALPRARLVLLWLSLSCATARCICSASLHQWRCYALAVPLPLFLCPLH